jgi:hypothetical protein
MEVIKMELKAHKCNIKHVKIVKDELNPRKDFEIEEMRLKKHKPFTFIN